VVDALALGDLTPQELAGRLGVAPNLLAHHLRRLEEVGLVERRPSDADRRRRYVTLRRDAVPGPVAAPAVPAGPVLFVCTHNSARSPFAAALWQRSTGDRAASAGSDPAARVNPQAVRIGLGFGVDLSGGRPRGFGSVALTPALVVTVCDRAREGSVPFDAPGLHWSLPDPAADGRPAAFREVFQEITRRLTTLAASRSRPTTESTR
jgi:protein-tyrosine-phosphatase